MTIFALSVVKEGQHLFWVDSHRQLEKVQNTLFALSVVKEGQHLFWVDIHRQLEKVQNTLIAEFDFLFLFILF